MSKFIRVLVGSFLFAGCAAQLNTEPAVTAIGDPSGSTVTTMVGPAGGTVRSADGALELIVPAGALAAETPLSVTPISVTAPGGVKSWRLGPEGTTFSQPATVKMRFTDVELGGSTPDSMRVAFQDSQRRWVTSKSNTIEGNTVAMQTTHLSDWSAILGWALFPNWPLVHTGSTIRLGVKFCGFATGEAAQFFLTDCQESGIEPLVANWSVNGITGGTSEVGTVQGSSASVTYSAPSKRPSPARVAVSVEFNPAEAGGKVLLVSNITVIDDVPSRYAGELSYHLKQGGPGTSILPFEYRVAAPVSLTLASGQSYDLSESQATLLSVTKENGITNCTCSATNVAGTVQSDTGAFVLRDGQVTTLQFSALFTVPMICTGSTDPACANYTSVEVVAWALSGQNPSCMNSVMAGYEDATHVTGSWSTKCPANPQLVGRIEETTWSLEGSQ